MTSIYDALARLNRTVRMEVCEGSLLFHSFAASVWDVVSSGTDGGGAPQIADRRHVASLSYQGHLTPIACDPARFRYVLRLCSGGLPIARP